MFGGLGLYSGEWFFALIDDDVLFFKVDDANREDYVSRGMKAFMPFPGQAEPRLLPGAGGRDRRSGGADALGAPLGRSRAARRASKKARLKPDATKKRKAPKKRNDPARKK